MPVFLSSGDQVVDVYASFIPEPGSAASSAGRLAEIKFFLQEPAPACRIDHPACSYRSGGSVIPCFIGYRMPSVPVRKRDVQNGATLHHHYPCLLVEPPQVIFEHATINLIGIYRRKFR